MSLLQKQAPIIGSAQPTTTENRRPNRFNRGDVSNDLWRGDIETYILQPNCARSEGLLKRAYEKLFTKFFPDEVEAESFEKWMDRINDPEAPSQYIVGVAGKNLGNHADNQEIIAGLFVGIYYKEADTGLLAYNIVDTDFQGAGIGRKLVEMRKMALMDAAHKNGGELKGLFLECNDPTRVRAEDDTIDPNLRLSIYSHMGARSIPIDYNCPMGDPEGSMLDYMMLLSLPHPVTGKYPQPDDVAGFLRGCFEVRGINPDTQAAFNTMMHELSIHKPSLNSDGSDWLLPANPYRIDNQAVHTRHKSLRN